MLLAWHFSIQAAAHDAAIVQVRAWLGNMNASAGHVQFRLLRGTLTIDDIQSDIQGSPLHIQSLLIKGNPASITTPKPILQQVRIQGIDINHTGLEDWQNISWQLPKSLKAIFRHAKIIILEQGHIKGNKNPFLSMNIQHLSVSGSPEDREIHGHGLLKSHEDNPEESWQLESFIPQDISQQTGKFITESATMNTAVHWSGAWSSENMRFNIERNDTDNDAGFIANLKQVREQWQGHIQTSSWQIHTPTMESTISGEMQILGSPNAWHITSNKILWQETTLSTHNTFIQTMTSYDVSLDTHNKHISMQRLDVEDVNLELLPTQPLFQSDWLWQIPSLNIQSLYISYGADDKSIELPAMNGVASIERNKVTLDISQQVDENQFWRLLTQKDGSIYLSASHVPLLQLRSLLPSPIRDQSYTVQGETQLALNIHPDKQWETSGKVYISDLRIASKKQSFSANEFQLNIPSANANGIQHASIHANDWQMQFPLTPRQAWSGSPHLQLWAKIPWTIDDIDFHHGQVLIGNQDSIWLSDADLRISNWQSSLPSQLSLHTKVGLAPLSLKAQLFQQPDQTMQWKTLDMGVTHANMFFLEDWLRISGLPHVVRGHISLSLQAEKEQQHVQGDVQLNLHRLALSPDKQQSKFLTETLGIKSIQPNETINLTATFAGEDHWDILAAQALLDTAKTELDQFQDKHDILETTPQRLGSLRIQQDIRLSLNERTRLRRLIKSIKSRKAILELVPDIGTAALTPALHQQVLATQSAIQSFLQRRGIHRSRIYAVLPQTKHHSTHDVNAVHINLVQ